MRTVFIWYMNILIFIMTDTSPGRGADDINIVS